MGTTALAKRCTAGSSLAKRCTSGDSLLQPCVIPIACCLPSGNCVEVADCPACEALDGECYYDEVCADLDCVAPPWACCFENGSCIDLLCDDCAGQGGECHWGDVCVETDCDTPPQGACCLPDGGCYLLTDEHCDDQDGEWQGNIGCADADCSGACCYDSGDCDMRASRQACYDAGGFSFQRGYVCSELECTVPCEVCSGGWAPAAYEMWAVQRLNSGCDPYTNRSKCRGGTIRIYCRACYTSCVGGTARYETPCGLSPENPLLGRGTWCSGFGGACPPPCEPWHNIYGSWYAGCSFRLSPNNIYWDPGGMNAQGGCPASWTSALISHSEPCYNWIRRWGVRPSGRIL